MLWKNAAAAATVVVVIYPSWASTAINDNSAYQPADQPTISHKTLNFYNQAHITREHANTHTHKHITLETCCSSFTSLSVCLMDSRNKTLGMLTLNAEVRPRGPSATSSHHHHHRRNGHTHTHTCREWHIARDMSRHTENGNKTQQAQRANVLANAREHLQFNRVPYRFMNPLFNVCTSAGNSGAAIRFVCLSAVAAGQKYKQKTVMSSEKRDHKRRACSLKRTGTHQRTVVLCCSEYTSHCHRRTQTPIAKRLQTASASAKALRHTR